jgi:hypothetical protein
VSVSRAAVTGRRVAAALAVGLALAAPAARAAFDEALYARLLQSHTREVADLAGTRVDYAGLGRASEWRTLVGGLDPVDPATVAERRARLAFWINAYNVLAIEVVLRRYPVGSIRDAGSLLRPVWKREAGRVGGKPRTLDEIEHRILRPLGEPRIHAAIVCASVSCPPLRREPYAPDRIDAQLADQMRRWLADPLKGSRVEADEGALRLSKVFDWFPEDFASAGGVVTFLTPYLPEATRAWLAVHRDPALRYFAYDWSLNDLAAARRANAAGR